MMSALLCMLALSSGSGSIAKSKKAIPAFEKVGAFNGRGGDNSGMIGPGPGGTQRFYVCYTYIKDLDLVAYDLQNGTHKIWKNDQGGAWAMELGNDNRLYLGTYFNGHVLRLDPETDKLDDLGQAIPGEEYIWDFSRGSDGMIYGATYPGAKLLQVDPGSGKMADLGRMDSHENYNRRLCAAPDGWVYCGIGSEHGNITAYNIATKELRSLIPDAERKPGFGLVILGDDGYAYGRFLDKSYRLRDGAATPIADLPPVKSRTLLKDGTQAHIAHLYPGRELPLFRIAAGPDSIIYGSTIIPEYLFKYDPASGQRETMGLIPGAEAYSMEAAHDKLFIASYTAATLQIYDPKKPFDPGTKLTNNPRFFGGMAPNQDRPYDMAVGADGKVYMACVPSYGNFGGAIAWYDPAADKVEYISSPIKDQAIASVCALPNGMMLFGTSTEGGPGTEPRTKEAVLFLWDPKTRQTVWSIVPLPGVSILQNLTLGGDGLLYGGTDDRMFVLDPTHHDKIFDCPIKSEGRIVRAGLLTLKDGRAAAITTNGACLLKFSRGKLNLKYFGTSGIKLDSGKAVVGEWLYAVSQTDLFRCRIPKK